MKMAPSADQIHRSFTEERANQSVLVVITKNSIDAVYPPLILAETFVASRISAEIHFTLRKEGRFFID